MQLNVNTERSSRSTWLICSVYLNGRLSLTILVIQHVISLSWEQIKQPTFFEIWKNFTLIIAFFSKPGELSARMVLHRHVLFSTRSIAWKRHTYRILRLEYSAQKVLRDRSRPRCTSHQVHPQKLVVSLPRSFVGHTWGPSRTTFAGSLRQSSRGLEMVRW